MEVKESNDHRVYITDYGIPTIQLGCGGVIISDLKFDNGFAGIGFSLGQGEVGEHHHVDSDELTAKDIGVFFQIIATRPESLQVVIDKLELAKAELESKIKGA